MTKPKPCCRRHNMRIAKGTPVRYWMGWIWRRLKCKTCGRITQLFYAIKRNPGKPKPGVAVVEHTEIRISVSIE